MNRPVLLANKIRDWPARNEALQHRGALTIRVDPAMTWQAAPTGSRGRQPDHRDPDLLSMKVLFAMALRQTAGMVARLLGLAGLDWPVPNYSALCRRQKSLAFQIPHRRAGGPLHLLFDSTRIKFLGESE